MAPEKMGYVHGDGRRRPVVVDMTTAAGEDIYSKLGVHEEGEGWTARIGTHDGTVVYLGKYPSCDTATSAFDAAMCLLDQHSASTARQPDKAMLDVVRRRRE